MNHIMIDLEMNMIERRREGNRKLSSELIEIGAVKMNNDFEVTDKYQSYVMPEFGRMDPHIIKLTGITDKKLEGAPGFSDAMDDFAMWIGEEEAIFYSWSMSDIRQILAESAFKGYDKPIIIRMKDNWSDFQEEFSHLLGIKKRIKLKYAVGAADYDFKGDAHTALADAVNTAEILRLSKDADRFNRVMKPVMDLFKTEKKGSTLGEMYPDFFSNMKKDSLE